MFRLRALLRHNAGKGPCVPRHTRKPVLELLEDRILLDSGLGSGAVLAGAAATRYVDNLYQVLLRRMPGPSEEGYWVAALQQGLTPATAAGRFLASPEYQAGLISAGYRSLLGRDPEPGAQAWWLVQMAAGLGEEQFTARVLASPEYYGRHGGDLTAWVAGLYQDVLDRAPDAGGLAFWTSRLLYLFRNRDYWW